MAARKHRVLICPSCDKVIGFDSADLIALMWRDPVPRRSDDPPLEVLCRYCSMFWTLPGWPEACTDAL